MKSFSSCLTLVLTIVLAGCSRPEPPPPPEVARPAKIFTVKGPEAMMIRSFPGEVRASDVADMAFRVSGRIIEFPASRGMEVKQGDLLLTIEAMKMETGLHADRDATVTAVHAQPGGQIDAKDLLIEME